MTDFGARPADRLCHFGPSARLLLGRRFAAAPRRGLSCVGTWPVRSSSQAATSSARNLRYLPIGSAGGPTPLYRHV